MKINYTKFPSNLLPITRSLTLAYVTSIIVAMIMTLASAVGILYRSVIYPTEELSVGFVSTDVLNLVVGLPILLGSMWLTRRGKLTGLICWPGALFYVLYIYISYLAIPVNVLLIPYIFLITLSAYSIIGIIVSINSDAVRQRLSGVIPAKTTGYILISFAILVVVYQTVRIITVLINQTPPDNLELVQWIDDLVVGSPALLVGGYLLLRRKALGYVAGAGLLLMCSVLFIGVIPAMVFQALSSNTPIDVIGILIVLISGMVCFVPFLLFVRGVAKTKT
ncbi:MAG: hypothetical protein ACE5IW_05950 [bacterium]